MEYVFSDNVDGLKPSAIREILKRSSEPGIIPFSAGNPSSEAFPLKEIADISNSILTECPISALQYSTTEGYQPLRDLIKNMSKGDNLLSDEDDILITSGAQQVMNLASKVLCNKGDVVVCENPSFVGSLNAFRSYGLKVAGVPVLSDGLDIEALENTLKTNKNFKFIYTIPNFQNPSGVTMSFEKRKVLYNLALEHNVLILEDNPYGALRFKGKEIPTIKSLDKEGIVIYAGSFSKVLAPGIRVGYALADKKIISKMTVCKQTDDVHTNLWAQMVTYRFLTEYDFSAHLKKIQSIYKEKAELCINQIEKHLVPKGVEYYNVEGGLFVWCKLPNGADLVDFCNKALDKKVAVVPGTAFLTDENDTTNWFRINYSTPDNEQIIKGIEILGSIL